MKILLTGRNGQVGYELERSLQGLGKIIAVGREELDLSKPDQIRTLIRQVKPGLIINPAAYTAVDRAEADPEVAMAVNGIAPGVMAEEAAKLGAGMIHYSTDYVFDGAKEGPYTEQDQPNPLNVYGQSKLAGERAIQAASIPHLILRTSWIYGNRGKNFLQTILRLAKERDELSIVADQIGAPTWSRTVADTTAHIIAKITSVGDSRIRLESVSGIYHLTAQGATSWYEFARTLLQNANVSNVEVFPIDTSAYPTPAQRPKNSVLSCELLTRTFCALPDWRDALALCQHE